MPYAVFVHVNLDPASDADHGAAALGNGLTGFLLGREGRPSELVTNVHVPTRTTGAIRGTVHAPFSRDFAGRPFGPSNCLPTVTTFADDVDAFLNGFVAISNAGTS